MFYLHSKSSEYAIRALTEITAVKTDTKFLARDICRKAGIPEAYARKTFQDLVRNGFLKAVSGPGGGYSLARDPSQTTVLDVLEAVEGKKTFSRCVLGLSVCSSEKPCSLHTLWTGLKSRVMDELGAHTLLELSKSVHQPSPKNKPRRKT